jgi:enoyl-CoA hydratase/carnithine racemase
VIDACKSYYMVNSRGGSNEWRDDSVPSGADRSAERVRAFLAGGQLDRWERVRRFEKPLIAAVQGIAIGGGTTLLTHCDFVYAGANAKFQLPFVNLALVPEFGSSLLLPLRLGYVRAAELILLGQPFDASQAAALGLVTWVVADQKVLATANEIAQRLTEKPSGALQACKSLMRRPLRSQLEQAVRAEAQEFAARVRSADAREAFTAFFEKRRPDFTKSQGTATSAGATNGS